MANEIVEKLSPREQDILEMWADGRTNMWIAEELGISRQTVQDHAKRVRRKLNATTSHGAVAAGFRQGLLK